MKATRALSNVASWVEAIDLAIPKDTYSKITAGPLTEGFGSIHNPKTGEPFDVRFRTS